MKNPTHTVAGPTRNSYLVIPTELIPRCLLRDLLQQLKPLLRTDRAILDPVDEGVELLLEVQEGRCIRCISFALIALPGMIAGTENGRQLKVREYLQ